jgi:acyl-CoA hydrolase
MDTFAIVRPEHLNHHGYLFGGAMLRWVDEFAWITASREFPGCTLVTMAMNDIVFRQRVVSGAILRFQILPHAQGRSSVTYRVEVFADEPDAREEKAVFDTRVTFVRLDDRGRTAPLPRHPRLPPSPPEREPAP